MSERVLKVAHEWVGLEFKPGRVEQCAAFVRAVFGEAGVPLGIARRPSDWELTKHLAQGPDFANSFFSDEVGKLITSLEEARPGDLLAFRNTYQGDFPPDCITHVGIYAGEGRMIDRSTSSEPVRHIELSEWWRERLAEIRRPSSLA